MNQNLATQISFDKIGNIWENVKIAYMTRSGKRCAACRRAYDIQKIIQIWVDNMRQSGFITQL